VNPGNPQLAITSCKLRNLRGQSSSRAGTTLGIPCDDITTGSRHLTHSFTDASRKRARAELSPFILRSEVLMALKTRVVALQLVILCGFVGRRRRFGRSYCLPLQKGDTVYISETSVHTYKSTQRCYPVDQRRHFPTCLLHLSSVVRYKWLLLWLTFQVLYLSNVTPHRLQVCTGLGLGLGAQEIFRSKPGSGLLQMVAIAVFLIFRSSQAIHPFVVAFTLSQ
jgi:hypothetical protein